MSLVDVLESNSAKAAKGFSVPYHSNGNGSLPARIGAVLSHLSLETKKHNTPSVVEAGLAEAHEQFLFIAGAIGSDPDSFATKLEGFYHNVMKKHGVDVKYGQSDLGARLKLLTPAQLDFAEAMPRFARKVANYAFDYLPASVDAAVRDMCYLIAPLPIEQLRSTDGRENYPRGEAVPFWHNEAGTKFAFVKPLVFDHLTLLDRLGAVNREARMVDELVRGERSNGYFFKALATEVALVGKAAWQTIQGMQLDQSQAKKAAASYANAFAQLMSYLSGSIGDYAATGRFDVGGMTEKARALFAPELIAAKPLRVVSTVAQHA